MKTLTLILILHLGAEPVHSEDRIWVDASINGKPVRLLVDTGSEKTWLFKSAADELGLKLEDAQLVTVNNLQVSRRMTEPLKLAFNGRSLEKRQIETLDTAYSSVDIKGVLGWHELSGDVFVVDAFRQTIRFSEELLKDTNGWTRFPLRTNWGILGFAVPKAERGSGVVFIDTGSPTGLGLCPALWQQWKHDHPEMPVRLYKEIIAGLQQSVRERSWATKFFLGGMEFSDIVIEESDPVSLEMAGSEQIATLGMAALKRVRLVFDGKHGFVYLKPRQTGESSPATDLQSPGAAFTVDNTRNGGMFAHVATDSVPYKAGLRSGDLLLRVNGYEIIRGRAAPPKDGNTNDPPAPPGRKLSLTLKRGDQVFDLVLEPEGITFLAPPLAASPLSLPK